MKRAGVARVRTTARLLERVLVARQVRLSSGAGELRSVLSEQVVVVALLLLQNPLNARPYRVPLTACVCECLRVALRAREEALCSWFPLHARNAPSRLVYCTITVQSQASFLCFRPIPVRLLAVGLTASTFASIFECQLQSRIFVIVSRLQRRANEFEVQRD